MRIGIRAYLLVLDPPVPVEDYEDVIASIQGFSQGKVWYPIAQPFPNPPEMIFGRLNSDGTGEATWRAQGGVIFPWP